MALLLGTVLKMQVINTSTDSPSDTLGRLALYSGLDVLTLFEIKDGLSALMDENRWAIYNFEMELQSPLLAMSLVGIPVDEAARREMVSQFTKEQAKLTTVINQMLDAIGYFEYYRNMAIAEFATHVDYSPLPKTWDEWLALPIQTRRALKEAAPEALVVFQKALKEFSEPFNPVSPAQRLKLFYSFFGSPSNTSAEGYFFSPPWLKTYGIHEYKTRNTKNEYEPAVNREALEKIIKAAGDDTRYAAYWAAPFAHVCLAISDLSKSLGFLKCKLEHGLFKASFGAVTETGRLASRQNAQGYGSNAQNVAPKLRHIFVTSPGEKFIVVDYAQIESRIVAAICYRLFGLENYIAATECLTADHEVLTPTGWVSIAECPETIACWYPNRRMIEFQQPYKWSSYLSEETLEIDTKTFSIRATPNHKVLYWGNRKVNNPMLTNMRDAYTRGSLTIPVSGFIDGTLFSEVDMQLLAAYQADGTINNRGKVEFSFSKTRKINRMIYLLNKAGVEYSTNVFPPYANQTVFTTRFYIKIEDWPARLAKQAGPWVLDVSSISLAAYVDECEFWDGSSDSKKGYRITNKSKTHLEWLGTAAHLCGRMASAPIPDYDSWRISIQRRETTDIGKSYGKRTVHKESVQVYCPTTKAGYFMFRRKGHIGVSGNSGDLHSLAASMVWPDLPWPKDFTIECCIKHGPFPKDMLKAAKKLASNPFYRGKSRRDVSKTLGHGTSYCGKPPQMSKHSHIEVKLIEHYQQVFFEAFPEIAKWHQWVVEQVQTKGEITTMLGRTRRFFGRPNDDATIREAVAYEPQSVAADYCNQALLRLHKLWLNEKFPATIRLSKHDELVVSCNESLEEQVLGIMREQMEEHITLVSPAGEKRNWFVPAECESGWNLGRKSDSNPNGIGHPLDGRKRVEVGGWKGWKF